MAELHKLLIVFFNSMFFTKGNLKMIKKLGKILLFSILLVSNISAKDLLSSFYLGIGANDNTTLSDTTFNGGFNLKFVEWNNFSIELETGLSMSDNDNNFLDLLPELSYSSPIGTFSVMGGLTVGYVNSQDVVGSSVGGKYTTPFEKHNLQVSYKQSSLETSLVKLEDIERVSVNYVYEF